MIQVDNIFSIELWGTNWSKNTTSPETLLYIVKTQNISFGVTSCDQLVKKSKNPKLLLSETSFNFVSEQFCKIINFVKNDKFEFRNIFQTSFGKKDVSEKDPSGQTSFGKDLSEQWCPKKQVWKKKVWKKNQSKKSFRTKDPSEKYNKIIIIFNECNNMCIN